MSRPICRNCKALIAEVPYEDQFCSYECYIEKYKDEDAEEPKMNGVEVLTNPFAWSR